MGNNDIYIGNRGVSAESRTIRIGTQGTQEATVIAGMFGASVNGVSDTPVIIDNTGKLGTTTSLQRSKKDIKPNGPSQRSDPEPETGHVPLQGR